MYRVPMSRYFVCGGWAFLLAFLLYATTPTGTVRPSLFVLSQCTQSLLTPLV